MCERFKNKTNKKKMFNLFKFTEYHVNSKKLKIN